EKPPDQPSTQCFHRPLPAPQVIPEGVSYRRHFAASYEEVFQAAVTSFRRKQAPVDANQETGLINSPGIHLTARQIRSYVVAADRKRVRGDGYALLSYYFQPAGEDRAEIGVAALIVVDDEAESPFGLVLTSNGRLEASRLDALAAKVRRQVR